MKKAESAAGGGIAPAGKSPGVVRRSLFRYSPALVLTAIAIADGGRFADPDLWGHLVFGRHVLLTGHLNHRDVYSFTAYGLRWRDYEWLSEALFAFVYGHAGVIGLKLMKFSCAALIVSLLALGEGETGAPESAQFAVLIASAVAIGPELQFRPQLFTFIFFAATLYLIGREIRRGAAPLWLMVPMMALWVNFHGGFFVGLAVLGLFCAIVIIGDLINGADFSRARRPGAILIGAGAATLCTPYGLSNWRAVANTLSNPATRRLIVEWRPLSAVMRINLASQHAAPILYLTVLGLFVAFGIALAIAPRADDFPLVAIAVVMIAGALIAVRNIPLAVIAAAGPLARHGGLALDRMRGRPDPSAVDGEAMPVASACRWRINQLALTAIALALAINTGLFSPRLRDGIAYPAGAVSFMDASGLRGNILNDFNWGEYLIYHLTPDSRVFIDSRYDMVYPPKVIGDYVAFYSGAPDAARVLAEWPVDFVLMPTDSAAARYTAQRPDWRLIYQDRDSSLYARTDSAAARLPGVPIRRVPPPPYFP